VTTELLNGKGVFLVKFYGGPERGICYQITVENKHSWFEHIILTSNQMEEVAEAYRRDEEA
jgi:hypothetical protein